MGEGELSGDNRQAQLQRKHRIVADALRKSEGVLDRAGTERNPPALDHAYTDSLAAVMTGRSMAGSKLMPAGALGSIPQRSAVGTCKFVGSGGQRQITSSSGTSFEGALVGSSLVMFMHDWPASFTSVTYPASGATTQYVSDLTPNTTYTISGAGVLQLRPPTTPVSLHSARAGQEI